MLIRNKKHFSIGIIMTFAFFGLFSVIMSPVFGNGMNGLEYADDMFNKLSKGSAYFAPKVAKNNEKFMGKQFSANIKFDNPEDSQRVAQMLAKSGASVDQKDGGLKVEGDLGKFLAVAINDADLMYKNKGEKLKAAYGYDEKKVLKDWWQALGKIDKALQGTSAFESAKMVAEVQKKLVETSYNYYKIDAQKVTDKVAIMSILLIFYVIYTLWWGYALYHLFEGLGLTAKKAKVKKEV
jgi:hypothetical protein